MGPPAHRDQGLVLGGNLGTAEAAKGPTQAGDSEEE
jgi:hypothetical protein